VRNNKFLVSLIRLKLKITQDNAFGNTEAARQKIREPFREIHVADFPGQECHSRDTWDSLSLRAVFLQDRVFPNNGQYNRGLAAVLLTTIQHRERYSYIYFHGTDWRAW